MAWTPPDTDTIVKPATTTSTWQPPESDTIVKAAQQQRPTANEPDLSQILTPPDYSPANLDWSKPARTPEELAARNFYHEQEVNAALESQVHPELSQTPRWEVIKNKLRSTFGLLGDRSKAGPSTAQVVGASSMLLPFGLPENLGKLLLGYFTVKTAADQPGIAKQIKQEIAHKEYSSAARDTVSDVLQLGMIGAGVKGMMEPRNTPTTRTPSESAKAETSNSPPAAETAAPSAAAASTFVPPATDEIVQAAPAIRPNLGGAIEDKNAAEQAKSKAASLETARLLQESLMKNQIVPAAETPKLPQESTKTAETKTLQPDDLQPALMVEGKPVTGGATHADIMENIGKTTSAEDVKDLADAVDAFRDDKNHVFVTPDGAVLSRRAAAKAIGVKGELHSEQLNQLKAETPPPTAKAESKQIAPGANAEEVLTAKDTKNAKTAEMNRRGAEAQSEKIKSAAVQIGDGTIYTGAWHPAAYEQYMRDKGVSKDQVIGELESGKIKDGFLTSSGRFVSRDEAAKIASAAKQFKPDKEGDVAFAGGLKGLSRESQIIKPTAQGGDAVEKQEQSTSPQTEGKPSVTPAARSGNQQQFKPGDKVVHDDQVKTVTQDVGADFVGVGKRAVARKSLRPATPEEIKTGVVQQGRVSAMGSSAPRSAARVAAEVSSKASRTAEQAAIPGAKQAAKELNSAVESLNREEVASEKRGEAKYFVGLRKAFSPTSLGDAAKFTGTVLRKMLGDRYKSAAQFDEANKKFRAAFDKRTTPRNFVYEPDKPLPPNWELQRAIDTGDMENLTPLEKEFAGVWNKFIAQSVEGVRALKPDVLQDLHEFYFARYWRDADEEMARSLSRQYRPWQGSKSFLKSRSIELWEDALKRGLRPRYDNPADAAATKLAEIEMFRSALQAHQILKDNGVRRFVYIFERGPQDWVEAPANDPSSKVYGPPTVTIKEAFDEQIRVKTLEMFKSLGIANDRLANIGGKRWGYAAESPEHVRTKFGGPDFVFWHEFGHIMDYRFSDLRPSLGFGTKETDIELRALADERLPMGDTGMRQRLNKKTGKVQNVRSSFSQYTRKAEEKMANVFDAYVRAPELFQRVAPTVYKNLLRWLELHPEVKGPLNDIRPSLKLSGGETEQFVGGPILLGRWMMPPDAAQVLTNYLSKGYLSGVKSLRGIKTLGGLVSNLRLISAFHGQMVGNDALASGISLPLYDAMKAVADRNPALLKRGARDLLLAPARPFLALRQGSKMLKAIRDPNANVSDLNKQLAQYAVDANLRAGHYNTADNASRRWRQNLAEAINTIKDAARGDARPTDVLPAAFDTLLHTPMAIAHEMMRPIMEWFVPRMKLGLAAPMIERVIADNPGMDPWEIRAKLGKVGDAVEDRVGQVTYDNLFQSRAIKDSGQLALQAYGWHLTKERLLWGGASDYFKAGKAMLTGKKPDITFRMTYLPALVITHAIIGGTLMYAMTGRRPKHLIDYLFPETGMVDAYGRPVRMALADFLKDYLGEWNAATHGPKAVVQEWERRLMPVWNQLADMYRNKDFWNTRIFSERKFDEPEYQHLWTNLKEGVEYLAGSSAPFSYKGAQRFQQSLGNNPTEQQKILATVGPFLGFVPAPMALTQSPAEARAAEIMRDSLPPMTKQQAQHSKLISDLVHDLRTGKLNDAGQLVARMRVAGVKDQAELTRIQQRVLWTPLQYQIHRLPLMVPGSGADAMSVWDLMNDKEKVQTAPVFMDKVQRAYEGGKLDTETTSRLVKVVMPYLKQAMAAKAKSATETQRTQSGMKAFSE